MKISEITDKMIQDYIEESREEFGDELETSMNLIAFSLRSLDEAIKKNDQEEIDKATDKMKYWLSNQMCRGGELECEDCGGKLEIYYEPLCFHCKLPEAKDIKLVNYLQVVKYLENNEPDFNGDELWEELIQGDNLKGNDSYMKISKPSKYSSEKYSRNVNLIEKHYPDIDNIIWFVSW